MESLVRKTGCEKNKTKSTKSSLPGLFQEYVTPEIYLLCFLFYKATGYIEVKSEENSLITVCFRSFRMISS